LAINEELAIKEADRVRREGEAAAEAQREIDMLMQRQALVNSYIQDEETQKIAGRQLAYQQELLDLQNALDTELITRDVYDQLIIEAERRKNEELAAINDDYRAREAQAEQILINQKIQGVQNAFSTISSLAEVFNDGSEKSAERAFNIQKGVQIAQASIDTFKAATGAYSSMASIPVVGPVLGALAAAAAVAAGLANVKKIASTKFEKGGGGGSVPSAPTAPAPITPASAPPSISLFGQANTGSEGQGQQNEGTRQQSVVKAVVVESDISGTQKRLASYQERAEIG
jgi:hypothetical protein